MQIRIAAVLGVLFAVSGCRTVEPEAPPAAPRITSFTTDKTRVAPGEQVTLTFAATGATLLELIDDAGNAIQLEGETTAGTAKVAPTRSSFFVLRATGAGGRDIAFVQVAVNEPLKDVFLIAVPAVINSGEQAQLLWGAPGASTVTLKPGSGTAMTLPGTTGTVTVSPAVTEQYTFTAQAAPGTPPLTALAEVRVRPVLSAATMVSPDGVLPGKTLTFNWTTAGATRLSISEMSLGQLVTVTDASSLTSGSFDYVVPATLPNGIEIADGLPLRFLVSATAGDTTVTKTIVTVVGELPAIEAFDAPTVVSASQNFTLSWKTLNAVQVTISVGGLPIFRTITGEQARVDAGSLSLPVPAVQTEYTLVATSARGAEARRTVIVRPVALPVLNTYTLTPTLNAFGDRATARWTTTNATRVQLRFENGPTLAVITTPSQVANGSVLLTPATGARVVLEAYNAAEDMVSDVKTVTFNGPGGAVVTPTPVTRGAQATLTWTLAPAGVIETVGLPSPAQTPINGSTRFVDLTTDATAEELRIDAAVGNAKLVPPAGFHFPMLGTIQPSLFVSVDGFITFAAPPALMSNSDFTASGNSAPSMIAPFWDDLTMGMASKVLYGVQTDTNGERFLVVQWEKVELAGVSGTELTFEVQLFETGQITFVYKTLSGAVNSATIGIKDAAYPVVQQFTYNSSTVVPVAGLELNFFTGGPADGMQTFTATRSQRLEFFGRTAMGLVPVSAEVRAFGPGDVSVTEAMPLPEASVSATGQWVELRNNATVPVDFDGLLVSSLGSSVDGGYVIPPGTVVAAGGFLVLGQSLNMTDNGGAGVTQVLTDAPLSIPDNVSVSVGGATLGRLSWDAGVSGSSVQAIERVLLASGSTFMCSRTRTFGPAGAIGTPGAANEVCAPYVVEAISPGFVDISTSGTEILASASDYTGLGSVPLTTPFTYFGQSYSSVNVAMVGFLTFGATPAESDYVPNDTTPATSVPNGVVAPFWDQIVRNTNGAIYMRQDPGRTIISWDDFRIYATTSEAHFQVHLLANGSIEFHYGVMTSASTTTLASLRGNSATAWLEKPDGTVAVPLSVNTTDGIQPSTSFRFTPAP
ncbi:MAG: lamin tail domain-containing protein [Archangium sp.]